MDNILTGQRVTCAEGQGEVLTIFGDKVIIRLDNGQTTTISTEQVEVANYHTADETDLTREAPEQVEARAEHASQIVAKLDHITDNNNNKYNQQKLMEISENAMDVINDLIEINNDRVEGFEKAGRDLEDQDNGTVTIFNKLADESRENVAELTAIAQSSGQAPVEGTSTSGAIHRAWLGVKSMFTGGDLESVLNECERGEDAIKAAYRSALDPENEISYELQQVLQKQQMGIVEGHDLIKSLRDQVKAENQEDKNDDANVADVPVYHNKAEGSAYGDSSLAYQSALGIKEEDSVYQEELETTTGTSKLMEFFVEELKDLLWAERKLVDTLPDMAEAATSQELKSAFTNHLAETEEHVERLEQIFGILGMEPDTTKCDAMAGIVDEGDNIISNTEEGTAQRDVGLIFAGQKAEHYEIASYGGMVSLAKTLGYYDIAEILVLTLDEEKTADALLTEIAENHVNYEAGNEPAED